MSSNYKSPNFTVNFALIKHNTPIFGLIAQPTTGTIWYNFKNKAWRLDEGQDFKPDWFDTLELFLNPDEDGHFAVFLDERQDLFDRWQGVPWDGQNIARKRLRKNCRNTKSIIEYINSEEELFVISGDEIVDLDLSEVRRFFAKSRSEIYFSHLLWARASSLLLPV